MFDGGNKWQSAAGGLCGALWGRSGYEEPPRSVSGHLCEFTGRDERGDRVNAKFRTPRMG